MVCLFVCLWNNQFIICQFFLLLTEFSPAISEDHFILFAPFHSYSNDKLHMCYCVTFQLHNPLQSL